jgi:SNF2 family DNA or RNA helicase
VDFLNWLKQEDPTKAERAAKAQALVKIGYLLRLSAKLKLKYAVDWINEFLENSDEKLVVFAVHTKCIDALQRRCMYKSVVIDGSVTGKDRNAAVNLFRNDNSVRLLIGNIRAAGVGVDGLQIASNAAFVELPWQPGAALQAEDRIHRIGTRSKAWIWYLVAHNTVESRLCNILQRKQNMLSSVLDGGKVAGDLDIFDKLMKEIGTEFDS